MRSRTCLYGQRVKLKVWIVRKPFNLADFIIDVLARGEAKSSIYRWIRCRVERSEVRVQRTRWRRRRRKDGLLPSLFSRSPVTRPGRKCTGLLSSKAAGPDNYPAAARRTARRSRLQWQLYAHINHVHRTHEYVREFIIYNLNVNLADVK